MLVHKEDRLVQETMHMVDSLDKLWKDGEMPKKYEHMLAESVEVLTAIVVIWYQEHGQIETEQDEPEEIWEGSTSILLDETTPPTG